MESRGGVSRALLMALLLLPAPLAASHPPDPPAPPQGPWSADQGCGGPAPFVNECDDPNPEPYDPQVRVGYSFLGFVGRIEITLTQRLAIGEARKEWGCNLFLMEGPPPVFTPESSCPQEGEVTPSWLPDLYPGYPTTVRCQTFPYYYQGTPVIVGDWGIWGCVVRMDWQG